MSAGSWSSRATFEVFLGKKSACLISQADRARASRLAQLALPKQKLDLCSVIAASIYLSLSSSHSCSISLHPSFLTSAYFTCYGWPAFHSGFFCIKCILYKCSGKEEVLFGLPLGSLSEHRTFSPIRFLRNRNVPALMLFVCVSSTLWRAVN